MLRRVLTYALFFFILWQVRLALPAFLSVFIPINNSGITTDIPLLSLLKHTKGNQTINTQIISLCDKHNEKHHCWSFQAKRLEYNINDAFGLKNYING